jgi:hypothetical protein
VTLHLDRSTRRAPAGDDKPSVLPPRYAQDIRDPTRDRTTLPALTTKDRQATKVTFSKYRG